jgi:hypothetical protein
VRSERRGCIGYSEKLGRLSGAHRSVLAYNTQTAPPRPHSPERSHLQLHSECNMLALHSDVLVLDPWVILVSKCTYLERVTLILRITHKVASTFYLSSSAFYSHLCSLVFWFIHTRTADHSYTTIITPLQHHTATSHQHQSPRMYTKLFISGLFATAFAAPLVDSRSDWIPEEGTRTTCAPEGNGLVGLFQGADGKELINAACAELMIPCAYKLPQYLPPGPQACKDVVVYPIKGSKTSTQTANILDQDGNKVSGKKLQCKPNHQLID